VTFGSARSSLSGIARTPNSISGHYYTQSSTNDFSVSFDGGALFLVGKVALGTFSQQGNNLTVQLNFPGNTSRIDNVDPSTCFGYCAYYDLQMLDSTPDARLTNMTLIGTQQTSENSNITQAATVFIGENDITINLRYEGSYYTSEPGDMVIEWKVLPIHQFNVFGIAKYWFNESDNAVSILLSNSTMGKPNSTDLSSCNHCSLYTLYAPDNVPDPALIGSWLANSSLTPEIQVQIIITPYNITINGHVYKYFTAKQTDGPNHLSLIDYSAFGNPGQTTFGLYEFDLQDGKQKLTIILQQAGLGIRPTSFDICEGCVLLSGCDTCQTEPENKKSSLAPKLNMSTMFLWTTLLMVTLCCCVLL